MSRRSISAVLILSLVFQALFIAPATFAAEIRSHQAGSQSHCSKHVPDGKNECPCCPDGASAVGGCMTLCAGSANAITIAVAAFGAPMSEAIPFVAAASLTHIHAPPNPPPIR